MTGRVHPKWCDVARQCSADLDGLPFSEGEHRSSAIPLDLDEISWAMKPGTVTAYVTQRACDTWDTRTFLHVESSVYGLLAHMPVGRLVGLADQLAGLIGPDELGSVSVSTRPARPVVQAKWAPDPVTWAATPPWGS